MNAAACSHKDPFPLSVLLMTFPEFWSLFSSCHPQSHPHKHSCCILTFHQINVPLKVAVVDVKHENQSKNQNFVPLHFYLFIVKCIQLFFYFLLSYVCDILEEQYFPSDLKTDGSWLGSPEVWYSIAKFKLNGAQSLVPTGFSKSGLARRGSSWHNLLNPAHY